MKNITLIILAATFSAMADVPRDYPILDKDVHMMVREVADGSAVEASPLYILLLPNNPVVFKTFDSMDMEHMIRDCLSPGSVLHFDPDPVLKRPTDAQIQSLKDYCKKLGITLLVSSTA